MGLEIRVSNKPLPKVDYEITYRMGYKNGYEDCLKEWGHRMDKLNKLLKKGGRSEQNT